MFYKCPHCCFIAKVKGHTSIPYHCPSCRYPLTNVETSRFCQICKEHIWDSTHWKRLHSWKDLAGAKR